METNNVFERTQGEYTIYGELDNLCIEVIQNKGTDDEYAQRIALVTGYDIHPPKYEENKANAEFIVKACNNHNALVEALKEITKQYEFVAKDICKMYKTVYEEADFNSIVSAKELLNQIQTESK